MHILYIMYPMLLFLERQRCTLCNISCYASSSTLAAAASFLFTSCSGLPHILQPELRQSTYPTLTASLPWYLRTRCLLWRWLPLLSREALHRTTLGLPMKCRAEIPIPQQKCSPSLQNQAPVFLGLYLFVLCVYIVIKKGDGGVKKEHPYTRMQYALLQLQCNADTWAGGLQRFSKSTLFSATAACMLHPRSQFQFRFK